ncbi:MAG: tetratricopeptide repeat protein [Phycisphaerales bacterium]|nr:tetratricopeptide repeat protein [Planctomycetota bacterium]MCH8507415.1 tetratricopeptide repeat protein [Phycisphaerales bacterium]
MSGKTRGMAGRNRHGIGRAAGVVLGLAALAGAGLAGWTLYRVATAPASSAAGEPKGPGIAKVETVEAVLTTVKQLIQDGQPGAAETVLSNAVRQFPADQDLRLAYADLLMTRERWADAYDQFLGAMEIGQVPATVEFTAGTLASMTDRSETAAEHYARAMRLDPNEANYPLYLASMQMRLNRLSEAKASLAIAGRLAPDRAQVWGMLAEIGLRENNPRISLQHIEKARAIRPNEPAWVMTEARVRNRLGESDRAVDLLHTLPQVEMERLPVLRLLAESYGLLGRPGEAASRFMDAAERSPRDAALAFEAAQWLERAGDRDAALRWARRAGELGHERAGDWARSLAAASDPADRP